MGGEHGIMVDTHTYAFSGQKHPTVCVHFLAQGLVDGLTHT
jgi:hypothetical protein